MAGAKLPSADSKHFNGFRAKFHRIAGGGLRAEASRRAARRRPPASSPHNFVPVFRLPLADCKDAMTTDTHHGAEAPFIRPDVWDAQRLASLLGDVGEAGLRDILRLFLADVPFLQAQLAKAIAAGDARAALQVLAIVQDSAEALGLAALASMVRDFHGAPLTAAIPDLLAQETARIRFVPTLKHAS
jgi:hypothetical protein